MRIKWTRHLDGSSSRRQDEGTETQEVEEEKKRGTSSSPSIFRIFRRKKNRKHGEDERKAGNNNGVIPPLLPEADEDDNASISSVATCASQPVSEGFHRDRASSLFSSFRLSLPGSKRKKRRIAPTPSETLLAEQNEPQPERYSTPDLRKPTDKLDVPSSTQKNLSTSSPSIRNPRGCTSISAQSLDNQNSESLDKLKWTCARSAASSTTKLSKSVSFSNCGDTLIDSSHSVCDKKPLRAVNTVAMVEESCRSVESELPTCMSDNLRMSRESKLTSVDDSSSSTTNASSLQKQPGDEAVDTTEMTKNENVNTRSSNIVEDNHISEINNILSNIASEIRNYGKSKSEDESQGCNVRLQRNLITSSINGDYRNETVTNDLHINEEEDGNWDVRANLKKTSGVQDHEIRSGISVNDCDAFSERCGSSWNSALLSKKENEDAVYRKCSDKTSDTEVPFNGNLLISSPPKLSSVISSSPLPEVDTCETIDSRELDVDDNASGTNENPFRNNVNERGKVENERKTTISSNKHVICHMRIYENGNENLTRGLIGAGAVNGSDLENSLAKNSDSFFTTDNLSKSEDSVHLTNCIESADSNVATISAPVTNSISEIRKFHMSGSVNNSAKELNSYFRNQIKFDQQVPDKEFILHKSYSFCKDHEVPEFELSLLEFEEVCNKYMAYNNLEYSYCDSAIPLYSNSPKRKSVLDLNFSFIYPHFRENGDSKTSLRNAEDSEIFPSCVNVIKQSIKVGTDLSLQNSCQSIAEEHSLPLLPKQWINYEKSIQNENIRDGCTDWVQRTAVRGKNLCQEPCLEALPIPVMLDDSDLGGIDTPQLSSTLEAVENKSGREHTSVVSAEKQQLSDDQSSAGNMISNVGIAIPSLNGSLDYSHISETPGKGSVYLDPQINDPQHNQLSVCNPLIYCRDGLETLRSENYLNGHNFCDIRNVGLGAVIKDVSSDFVQGGNRLIEISNPYQEDIFVISNEFSNRNLMNGASISHSNVSTNIEDKDCNLESSISGEEGIDLQISECKTNLEDTNDVKSSKKETSVAVDDFLPKTCATSAINKLMDPVLNGDKHSKENRLNKTEQKNFINKNKNSMIPCRKKGHPESETKKTETKPKGKKNDSIPKFHKNEHVLKNNSSLRMFSNSYKDSDVEQHSDKQKNCTAIKLNGNCSDVSSVNSELPETRSATSEFISEHEKVSVFRDSGYYASKNSKTFTTQSKSTLKTSDYSDSVIITDKENDYSSCITARDANITSNQEFKNSRRFSSSTAATSLCSQGIDSTSKFVNNCEMNNTECAVSVDDQNGAKFVERFNLECLPLNDQVQGDDFSECSESVNYQEGLKQSDYLQRARCSSLPVVGMLKTSLTSSKESLNSQLTNSSRSNKGRSRIPRKQSGARGASTKGPVRPPLWLSKAELTQEIQRLGNLCEARTKELNRLKMETKHVSVGFDAFAALFKYMVEDLNALSVPALTEDLEKTLKQLELTKQDLAYYEREVEEMKSHHCQELNDLSNKLFEVYQSEVAELNAKHQEEISHLKSDHQKQIEHLTATFDASSSETKAHHEKMIASLEQEIINQREELQIFQEREIKDLEEKHAESSKLLQDHIEQLQKKCAELKQHSMSMEDAMRKDTDSKLQWVTAAKLDLEKEVESLKTVLEMKNKELHTLRVQNLEMEKQLEELPFAREKIKMLQARAEDLEALMLEKTKVERKLSTENQQIRDTYEKEAKVNRRLSMENEELQWRLRQAENSLISGSFTEVPEFPETDENAIASPTKSPGPQLMSRSVFFTFIDKDESSPHSPRSQYKKITPSFSANYKTSPAKSSKSPPAPSPRRAKSHSEPPQPITSTPRKVAKQPLNKSKGPQKRQRSGSDSGKPFSEHTDISFSSVTESMASSVSSESSVFEHRERLLEENKEHIIRSLEILREQRSTESSVDEPTVIEKKWCSDDIKITGELSNLETEDMSRSAEFADPKTYYHMTFPVLKESGITDCDMDDGCKNLSSGSSPTKEIMPNIMHSKSEANINSSTDADGTLQVMSMSSQEVSMTAVRIENKRNSCTEISISDENVQKEATDSNISENRWRTI